MNKKKGFTLVELVAVIALLAVILLLVIPNVVRTFDKGKNAAFTTLVQDIYRQSEKDFAEIYALEGYKNTDFCSYNMKSWLNGYGIYCEPLNFNDETAYYYVKLNNEGKVMELIVSDDEDNCYYNRKFSISDVYYGDVENGWIEYDEDEKNFYCYNGK